MTKNAELVHLDLRNNGITEIGATVLCNSLRMNEQLISLDLGNGNTEGQNKLGPKACVAIKDYIKSNHVLSFLGLKMTYIGD